MPSYTIFPIRLAVVIGWLALLEVSRASLSSQPAIVNGSVADALRALRERGVAAHNLSEFRTYDPQVILDTCRWFDEQSGRVGPGVLVEELRGGGKQPTRRPRSIVDRQREYADQTTDWLREHFPDLDRPRLGPHPAAVAAVIRLHHQHGKGSLTVAEHGPEIRQAVRDWHARYSETVR